MIRFLKRSVISDSVDPFVCSYGRTNSSQCKVVKVNCQKSRNGFYYKSAHPVPLFVQSNSLVNWTIMQSCPARTFVWWMKMDIFDLLNSPCNQLLCISRFQASTSPPWAHPRRIFWGGQKPCPRAKVLCKSTTPGEKAPTPGEYLVSLSC